MGEEARKLGRDRLILASHNEGKLREINALLAPFGVRADAAASLGLDAPEETGATFEANAALKARAAAMAAGAPALADDSGLAVDALDGAPGVHSARWAGEPRCFSRAMARLEAALRDAGAGDFSARFVCVLCIAWPDGETRAFRGETRGRLAFPPRGANGFGYDPIFIPDGAHLTFAEMSMDAKEAYSHRAKAWAAFARACLTRRE